MDERWVFLNGDFYLEREAKIPVTDRGFLYGDGIFTTIRVDQGRCELFNGHLQRLQRQAEILNFSFPPLEKEWIHELIERNKASKGTWRLKIILTVKEEGNVRVVDTVLATLHHYQPSLSESCRLSLFPHPFEGALSHLKSLSYLDNLYVRNYAIQKGYDDAIKCTSGGILLETGCSNFFWIDRGECWIPDPQLPYINGVFLQALLTHLSMPIHFVNTTIHQIPPNANFYVCNALMHVRPVVSIDHVQFKRNPDWEKVLQNGIARALKADRINLFEK